MFEGVLEFVGERFIFFSLLCNFCSVFFRVRLSRRYLVRGLGVRVLFGFFRFF